MRTTTLAALLLLSAHACVPQSPTQDDAHPPPQGMQLTLSPLIAGMPATMESTSAVPGTTVWFIRGSGPGAGPCPGVLQGACIDVLDPLIVGSAIADLDGRAVLTVNLPANVPEGATVELQAVAVGTVSNTLPGVVTRCGNGQLDAGETCDDGNRDDLDDCTNTCEAQPPIPTEYSYTCTRVSDAPAWSDGYFSLKAFNGAMYGGVFGYNATQQSFLFRSPSFSQVLPGITGISESICKMEEHAGWLYANTESSGNIYRSADGTNWQQVYDGPDGTIGCGMASHAGAMYAVNYDNTNRRNGRILRSFDGTTWSTVYDSGNSAFYIRDIITHAGMLHALLVDETTLQGWRLLSVDGVNWTPVPTPTRFLRGFDDGYDMYAGGTRYTSNGASGIWRLNLDGETQVHSEPNAYVTEIKRWDHELVAGTSAGWKFDQGDARLLVSTDDGDSWDVACTVPDLSIWSIEPMGDRLYFGTWEFQVGGGMYEVTRTPVTDPPVDTGEPDLDCNDIAMANPAWEVCDVSDSHCSGVFTDGAGCNAFCAAAGLTCTARYGGEPGCQLELQNPWSCDADNGHMSDWCQCGTPGSTPVDPPPAGSCTPAAGNLAPGQSFTVEVDAHTGDEETTQPRTDANDNRNGDSARFRRTNVARAHLDYWYTSAHQEPGEPSPSGVQFVDYTPPFVNRGIGRYRITARYRQTENRADYNAEYIVHHAGGSSTILRNQTTGTDYVNFDLGEFFMCDGSFVRVNDPGSGSITFNEMTFTYLGP